MLNLIAACSYLLFLIPCIYAARCARRVGRPSFHASTWLVAAALLALLSIARFMEFEDAAREALRSMLDETGVYGRRRSLQWPVMVAAGLALLGGSWFVWTRILRDRTKGAEPNVRLAQLAIIAFIILMAVRIISLHATDRLLYAGPVRLNYILDAGLSGGLALLALLYLRHCQLDRG